MIVFYRPFLAILLVSLFFPFRLHAQHHEHTHGHTPADSITVVDVHAGHEMPVAGDPASDEHAAHAGSMSALMATQPMARDGSGTSWHPDAAPVEGLHGSMRAWRTMVHGAAFLRYSAQDVFDTGRRGGAGVSLPNWVMGMGVRPLGSRSQIALRAMLTAEPFTQGGAGYPLLFQTGETYRGIPLVDSQHPHDLFAELSVTWSRTFGKQGGVFLYAGMPGEPALGPPAFMHRPSARHLPDSPIGHHWQDATHVTFGVATAGVCYGPLKLDVSVFTGREPDEERLGFDRPRFDSYSARASVNVGTNWSIHLANGYITEPESVAPGEDMRRTTASVLYARKMPRGVWSAAGVWGYNRPVVLGANHIHPDGQSHTHTHHSRQHAFLGELDWSGRRQALYGRFELVQKGGNELGLPTLGDHIFWLSGLTAGTARYVHSYGILQLQVGAQATVNRAPDLLEGVYGKYPVSAQAYLRLSLG